MDTPTPVPTVVPALSLVCPPRKHLLQSKTFWANIAVALIPLLIPAVQDLLRDYPSQSATVIAILNIVLRVVTTNPVTVKS